MYFVISITFEKSLWFLFKLEKIEIRVLDFWKLLNVNRDV
jgi:hypothetical protein